MKRKRIPKNEAVSIEEQPSVDVPKDGAVIEQKTTAESSPELSVSPTIIIPGESLLSTTMSRIAQTIASKYGQRSMMYLKEHPDYTKVPDWISTQNCAIDWVLSGKADGTGGLPVGRIIELFGDPSSGKSLLLTQILAEVQRRGGIPVLYDPEATFDGYFAGRVGLDVNAIMYSKGHKIAKRKKLVLGKDGSTHEELIDVTIPATVEEMKKVIEDLIDITYHEFPGVLLAIGLDSVAALSTEHELKEPGKKDLTKASEIRSFVKMLEGKLSDQNCIFIATNHVIANINIENRWDRKKNIKKDGPKEDKATPAGSGLPFGSSVRMDLTRGNDILENKTLVTGHEIYVYTHKNKVWPAHKATIVEMKFDSGMNRYSGLMEILLAKDIVEELGDQVFRFKGQRFKRKSQEKPKYIGLEEMVEKFPEILTLSNEL